MWNNDFSKARINYHRPLSERDGWLYLFSIGYDNLYKVGATGNWQRRFSTMSASNPKLSIVCVASVKLMFFCELCFHTMFCNHNHGREIYRFDADELRDVIWFYSITHEPSKGPGIGLNNSLEKNASSSFMERWPKMDDGVLSLRYGGSANK